VYFRIIKNGMRYSAFMSGDGKNFTLIGEINHDLGDKPKIGLTVDKGSGSDAASIPAQFDYFHVLYNCPAP
jgi:hypothetical protein